MAGVRRQTSGWQVRWPVMDDGMWTGTVRGVHSQYLMTLDCLSAAALGE